MTDDQIIAAVLSGDRHRFRGLVERHERVLLQYLHNLLPNRHDCEELAQEAFLPPYTHLSRFDASQSSFRTWLLVIARRRALNFLAKHRPVLSEQVPEQATVADPAAGLTRQEQLDAFDRALEMLPLEQRSAFVLAEIQELPYAEIAMIEQVPLGTVKSRVSRQVDAATSSSRRIPSLTPTMNEPEHPDRDELPGDHHPAYQLWLERRRTLGEPLEGGLADRVIAALEGLEPTSTQSSPPSPPSPPSLQPTTGPAVAPRSVKGESVAWRWLRRAGQQAIVVAATLACLVRLCLILIPFTRLH